VKLCTGNPSAVWYVSFLTCADSELLRAEPDRVVDALEEVPRPQTAEAPIGAADATPRSRPTRIRKYEPALAPWYDAEWGESVDPGLSNCGRSAPPAPDSYSRAPYRPPITFRRLAGANQINPIPLCFLLDHLHSPPPTQLPILDLVREVLVHLVMPQHLAQLQWRSPSTACSCVAPLLSRFWSTLSRRLGGTWQSALS
jgi:hypothetical protein